MKDNRKPIQQAVPRRVRLVVGLIFFIVYFGLGVVFLFVRNLPFEMSPTLKTVFGLALIAYSIFRLARITNALKKPTGVKN